MSGKALTSSATGWRREPALHTGQQVGKLFIPKSKLKQLRHKIKVKVRGNADRPIPCRSHRQPQPHHHRLAELLPLCRKAWREFAKLDWWLDRRMAHWVRQKHAAQCGKRCSASMSETDPGNGDAGATEPNS